MEDFATLCLRCSCKPGRIQISISSVSVEYKSRRVHRLYPIATPNSDFSLQCSKYLRVRSIEPGYRCTVLTLTLRSSPVWPLCSDNRELFSWCSAWTLYVLSSQPHCSQRTYFPFNRWQSFCRVKCPSFSLSSSCNCSRLLELEVDLDLRGRL